jgi:hypothetical protein
MLLINNIFVVLEVIKYEAFESSKIHNKLKMSMKEFIKTLINTSPETTDTIKYINYDQLYRALQYSGQFRDLIND